jgi:hypothetical protein
MKKTTLILSLLISISAFSQNVSYTFTLKEKQLKLPKSSLFNRIYNGLSIDNLGNFLFWDGKSGIHQFKLDSIYMIKQTGYLDPAILKLDMNKNMIFSYLEGFSIYKSNKFFLYPTKYDMQTYAFDIDKNGVLWFNDVNLGLTRSSDNKTFTSSNSGILPGNINLINCDIKGNVWILLSTGLSKFDGVNWTNYTNSNSNFPGTIPTTFVCDTIGNLWFGSTTGLTKFDGLNWFNFDSSNSSIANNKITTLALDYDYQSIWIGTEDGISRFDGVNWQTYNSTNSNLPAKLYSLSIASDKQGNLWFSNSGKLSMLCKNFNNLFYNQVLTKITDCPGQGIKLSAPQGAANYFWSSGQKTPSIQITTPGDYNVLIYDSLGCPYMTQTLTVSASDFQMSTPSLCMVTNNEKYNKVVWEQLGTLNISKYKIYKQNTQNSQYEFYKNQDAKLQSEYIDSLSNPNSQIDRYKISYLDTCGNESALSANHSSILLSTSMGLNNNINLSWNAYEGFTAPNYEIWRSIDGVNYSLLTSVANNTFSYVDLNAPSVVSYQIRVSKSGGCNPAKRGGVSYVGSNIKSINSVPLTINVNGVLSNQSSISLCLGDSIKLSGNNSGNYVWDNAILNNSYFKPTVTKIYQVSGTDGSGNVKTNSIEVVVNSKPKAQISSSKITVCQGDNVVLTASGAKNSTWNNSVVNGVDFVPKSSLKYAVRVTDDNNCSDTASVLITVNPLPTKPTITIDNSNLISSVASQYQWFYNGSLIPNETNQILKINKNGSYSIEIKDGNGCMNTSGILEVKSLSLYELKNNRLLVYPNPSSGIFTINSSINSSINLYDIYGTHIAEYTENTTQIDLSNYANGVYFLKTQQSNKEEVVKLILNK